MRREETGKAWGEIKPCLLSVADFRLGKVFLVLLLLKWYIFSLVQ